eukprot:2847_1
MSSNDDSTTNQNNKKRKLEETESEEMDYTNITEMDLELKEFKCPRCEEIFSTSSDLFIHMRKTYEDPTICQLCQKNLNCMANVLSHSYLHQDIKPYKCPKCKYSTRTRFNLRVHLGSCAKIERFSYKRGNATKRRKTDSSKSKKRNNMTPKKNNNEFIANENEEIGNINTIHMYSDDALGQLIDSGPISGDRDTSCLIQVHIQHFPRATNNITNQYYQNTNQTSNGNANDVNDNLKQYYPPAI